MPNDELPEEVLLELLRNLPELEVPRDFTLGPRAVEDPPNVIRLRRWYTWTRVAAASLAACFVLLVGGTVYVDQIGPPRQAATSFSAPTAAPAGQAAPAPAAQPRVAVAPTQAPPAAPAAPAAAARTAPSPTTDESQPEQVAAGTGSKPLPTATPTPPPIPTAVPVAQAPRASPVPDPAAPLRTAAAVFGVLAALTTLGALTVRHRLVHPED